MPNKCSEVKIYMQSTSSPKWLYLNVLGYTPAVVVMVCVAGGAVWTGGSIVSSDWATEGILGVRVSGNSTFACSPWWVLVQSVQNENMREIGLMKVSEGGKCEKKRTEMVKSTPLFIYFHLRCFKGGDS